MMQYLNIKQNIVQNSQPSCLTNISISNEQKNIQEIRAFMLNNL
jgi:hypothetical protein